MTHATGTTADACAILVGVLGAVVALILGGAVTAIAWRRTMLARGHRDVAGFSLGLALTGVVAFATITAVLAPGMWSGLYDAITGIYGGNS